ncbi:small-conductance mechanosensitive channel [Inquilinus ginsengisoli]|uniref:Small-conductance mechanosensitive channel n=1 Tax=Inquilinus ginsengisoli TaxID=363840 RepID=A0ABU1JHQ8_9PROT|nr:mechanosensitive ion channel family protein [Inquilinus ginsengisoli]MDR6288118.1 small-conductance mechanosensitive channel [Inquilinus ginsengisoli]
MTAVPMMLHAVARLLAALAVAGLFTGASAAAAEDAAPAPAEVTQPAVQRFLDLLADPAVRDWLAQQNIAGKTATTPGPAAADAVDAAASPSHDLATRLEAIRHHTAALAAALPALPDEFRRAGATLYLEVEERGPLKVLLLALGFAALGFGAEWLFRRATARVRERIGVAQPGTVGERLRLIGLRLADGLGLVTVFALGSIGAFLALEWPMLLREIVLGYLVAFVALRLALVIGRVLLAPGGRRSGDEERFRIVPMDNGAARFWHLRLGLFVGWFAFGSATLGLLSTLGFTMDMRQLVAYVLGLGLLALGIEIAWRRPRAAVEEAPELGRRRRRRVGSASAWLLSTYFLALWLFWVVSAIGLFWLGVVVVALPVLIRATQRSVNHVLRPAGESGAGGAPGALAVGLERGVRAVLIIGAALLLARGFRVDLGALTVGDTVLTRLVRGAINAVIILLLADVAWHIARALIDRALASTQVPGGHANSEEVRRQARLRTLLPILRNVLFIILLVMAALMALSSLGVEIAPLIAGAGVVGVAIGFGAQTVVKDIISGMFFLLDDAFRVGEYVQSGAYKGTVESFSLRSVKLRHQRGPLFTVPFGELGAIQNMSRDWVIDKLSIGVTYDTDLDQVKKLVKEIGKELAQDPELAPHIIDTLKMQGVEQFGDYAIQIRLKLMAKPGEQFVIRRRAFALIKKAFDANGIKFAFPTVQVAGGEPSAAAVAQQGMALVKAPPAV